MRSGVLRSHMRLNAVLAAVLINWALLPLSAQTSVEDIVKRSQDARAKYIEAMSQGIVLVEAYKDEARKDPELGTGIVLTSSPDKIWILTALHVVREARSVDIMFYSTRPTRYRASILARRSDSLDLALLEVSSQPTAKVPLTFPAYKFLQNSALHLGDPIYSVNGDWSLVPNTISHLSHEGDAQRFEYTNTSVGVGFSGGPVFDQYGNVVGMHDALSGDEAHYAIAIKIDSALQTLGALDYAVPKAVPFSMPQFSASGVPATPVSGASASDITTHNSGLSDTELYQKALLSRDPAAIEAAADKMSNPTLASALRMQAKALRATIAAAATPGNVAGTVPTSRMKAETEYTKVHADAFAARGNYKQAFPLYRQLAEAGDSESMVNVGYLYYDGWGVSQDYGEAAKWFKKAGDAGETKVMSTLGLMYAMGRGVEQNDKLAVEWNRKAAAVGDPIGMLGLGAMYYSGRGVPKDLTEAANWYRKAAALGNEAAKQNLRKMGLTP